MKPAFRLIFWGLLVSFGTSCRAPQAVFSPPRSTVYAPAPEQSALPPADSAIAIPAPVPQRLSHRAHPVALAAPGFAVSSHVGRAAVRRLARIRAVAAHVRQAPTSNLGRGLGKVLLIAAIVLLVVIGLVIVAVSAPTTLAGQIAIGILAAAVLGVLASIALQ
jgi:hypothetical protein